MLMGQRMVQAANLFDERDEKYSNCFNTMRATRFLLCSRNWEKGTGHRENVKWLSAKADIWRSKWARNAMILFYIARTQNSIVCMKILMDTIQEWHNEAHTHKYAQHNNIKHAKH